MTQLQSSDVMQRSRAVLQLRPGTINDEQAISALVNVLCTDDDLNVVEDATWALVRYGTAATSALLNEITHENARTRHQLVHALGKIADQRAVPALIAATKDSEPSVRLKSVYALGQIGDSRAIDALIASLEDPVQDVQWTAREVLEGFGEKALSPLIQALTVPSAQVRELAANVLGEIADDRAVDALIAALIAEIQTEDWQVRFAILEALGNIGDLRALPVVKQSVDDPHPHVQAMAKTVLKGLDGQKKG